MQYAANTEVSVERSKAEIEGIVMRYGASGFMSGWKGDRAMVQFEMRARRIRFILPLPGKTEKRFTQKVDGRTGRAKDLPADKAFKLWEQSCRQRWRALSLAVKAKLESVESGISEFDQEFMAQIVLPDGLTIAEHVLPKLAAALEGKPLPPMLPA